MCRRITLFLTVTAALLAVLGTSVPTAQERPAATDSVQSAPADSVPPDLVRARELMDQLEASIDSLLNLDARMKGKDEEAQDVMRVRGQKFVKTISDNQPKLLYLIRKLDAAGIPADEILTLFQRFITAEADIYNQAIRFWAVELDDHR